MKSAAVWEPSDFWDMLSRRDDEAILWLLLLLLFLLSLLSSGSVASRCEPVGVAEGLIFGLSLYSIEQEIDGIEAVLLLRDATRCEVPVGLVAVHIN